MGQGGTVMKLSGCTTILSLSASLALALATGSAAAQSLPPPFASYAAKFACGFGAFEERQREEAKFEENRRETMAQLAEESYRGFMSFANAEFVHS
jgi:hypothetical protein